MKKYLNDFLVELKDLNKEIFIKVELANNGEINLILEKENPIEKYETGETNIEFVEEELKDFGFEKIDLNKYILKK
ncbi:hypothetical protein QTJ04_14740 [Clostridium perfringens]|uniref:hypothetical protein n=1 Tax=Clostridium perfringens TaxID=1502 RepID=UPI001C8559B9|nr:hypothetical protein [Clostridium perfringens]MDM1007498.1 hypothetical protein [Clostridium perfringens]